MIDRLATLDKTMQQIKAAPPAAPARPQVDPTKTYTTSWFDQWRFVDGRQRQNRWPTLKEVPARTEESDAFSKDLRSRGFSFVGSTIMYAHMQAVGMVNDHVLDCFRHRALKAKR